MVQLSAVTLKDTLWSTLNEIKDGSLDAAKGDAIASQAREILRTIKTQVLILDKAHRDITKELSEFAG